jgi:hypothetical protein
MAWEQRAAIFLKQLNYRRTIQSENAATMIAQSKNAISRN